ncbi:MAG TPA: hypothetical protein PLT92_11670 [Ignavibacteriaceae bacterium]|nr:hypothetical protein [Ignavibacteriaceae bacterium]
MFRTRDRLIVKPEEIQKSILRFKDFPKQEFVHNEREETFNILKTNFLMEIKDRDDVTKENLSENKIIELEKAGNQLSDENLLINQDGIDRLNKLIKSSCYTELVLYLFLICSIISAITLWVLNATGTIIDKQVTLIVFVLGISLISLTFLINGILLRRRYSIGERYIIKGDPEELSRRSLSILGYKMTTSYINRYENNITGLVYFGAGLLVIVVGLRGLGDKIEKLGFPFPSFVIEDKSLALWVIFVALFLEFSLLVCLAVFTFFKDEKENNMDSVKIDESGGRSGQPLSIDNFKELIKLSQHQPLKVDFSELEGLLATLNTNVSKGLIYRDRENPTRNYPYLDIINKKIEFENLKNIFASGLQELASIDPSNVTEFSVAIEKISKSLNGISSKLNENKLQEQLISFNKTIMEIKQTLGVKFNDGNNGNKPITNQ